MRTNGTVKWYRPEKNYGFIAPDMGEKDIFVHRSALDAAGIKDLREEQRVSFDVEEAKDGRCNAVRLELI